jgi:hypothetical protein
MVITESDDVFFLGDFKFLNLALIMDGYFRQ